MNHFTIFVLPDGPTISIKVEGNPVDFKIQLETGKAVEFSLNPLVHADSTIAVAPGLIHDNPGPSIKATSSSPEIRKMETVAASTGSPKITYAAAFGDGSRPMDA